jgi:hypothetical protein
VADCHVIWVQVDHDFKKLLYDLGALLFINTFFI